MEAILEYCGNRIEIFDFIHWVEDERAGNSYNSSFSVRVRSGPFSGVGQCVTDYKAFRRFITALRDVTDCKADEAVLEDYDYGGNVRFAGDGLGHVEVSGTIYGEGTLHSLTFSFPTDQTIYASFLRALERME